MTPYSVTPGEGNQAAVRLDPAKPLPRMHGHSLSAILHYACAAAWIARVHPATFLPLKNRLQGQHVAVLGCGPSLRVAPGIRQSRTIACNRAANYLLDHGVHTAYLFAQDNHGTEGYLEELLPRLPQECIVMLGTYLAPDLGPDIRIAEHVRADPRVRSYATGYGLGTAPHPDLDAFPLVDFCTIVHPALHFALYTGAERIYLLGCDTDSSGYFDPERKQDTHMMDHLTPSIKLGYAVLRALQQCNWPRSRIISVNPVGLRGMFDEVWTEAFLRERHIEPGPDAVVVESI